LGFISSFLIEESNLYIARGKFPPFSHIQWILLKELLSPEYKELLKDQYESSLDILLEIIKALILLI